jgi:hypothetical protein
MRLRIAGLLLASMVATACTTRESESRTPACRASTDEAACAACCEDPSAVDRTNASELAAPGDCRCISCAWFFLQ